MKVVFLDWECFGNKYIKKEFLKRGFEIVDYTFSYKKEDTRAGEEMATKIAELLIKEKPDFVFSFNYFPVVAIAAKACKVKYISWTYDSPYIQIYSKTIDYDTNYAFVFDKSEYVNLINKGISNVYFLPMAGAVDDYDEICITDKDHKKYDADIAMIGSMYTEPQNRLFRHFSKIDDYSKGYLEAVMEAQKNIYGMSILEASITDDMLKRIQKTCPVFARGDGYESAQWVLANYFIARELTARERGEYLDSLSKKYNVSVYTTGDTSMYKNIHNRGSVEYYTDAPKAMKCAKINLNISLRSIVTGIPLRVFDIMAAGGFLLTTFQADMLDYFVPDEDFVYFENVQDLIDKAGYYLEHSDERERIAASGYAKVKAYHNFSTRVDSMLKIAFGDSFNK